MYWWILSGKIWREFVNSQVVGAVRGQVGAVGEVLAQQPVGVLIQSLPRAGLVAADQEGFTQSRTAPPSRQGQRFRSAEVPILMDGDTEGTVTTSTSVWPTRRSLFNDRDRVLHDFAAFAVVCQRDRPRRTGTALLNPPGTQAGARRSRQDAIEGSVGRR